MKICKVGALALAAALSSGLLIGQASAMPANGMAAVASKVGNATQEVRWIGGGWRGIGWRGAGWRGVGWRGAGWRGVGWRGAGWRGGWAGGGWGWGYRRPLFAAAAIATGVGLASAAWNSGWYGGGYYGNPYYASAGYAGNPYFSAGPYYDYAGPAWTVGWRPGFWGWRRRWWW